MDRAAEETEKLISQVERQLAKEYKQATKEVKKKLDVYLAKFAQKDAKKAAEVKQGKITQADYIKWRHGQIMMSKRWYEMTNTLAKDLTKVDKKAMSIVNGYTPEAYALNHNYATFEVETGSLLDTSYTLYNRDTVEGIVKKTINHTVNTPLDIKWNKQHIQSAILQGVLQGESIPQISKRLASVTSMDMKAATRNARTMITSAQNAGRQEGYARAEKMGIEVKKQWIATLDQRTRDSHAVMHGVIVGLDEKFQLERGELRYPADPQGHPAEVYNCRCTVAGVVTGVAEDIRPEGTYTNSKLDGETFDEWIERHQDNIDKRAAKRRP